MLLRAGAILKNSAGYGQNSSQEDLFQNAIDGLDVINILF